MNNSIKWLNSRLRTYAEAEQGNILIIAASAFLAMFAAAGGAVDYARFVIARNQAQQAIDNALISGVAVRGTGNVSAVTNQFYSLNFPSSFGNSTAVTVRRHNGGQRFTAETQVRVPAFFGGLVGVNGYTVNAFSEVVIDSGTTPTGGRLADVEIALTIDNSRSMCLRGSTNTFDCTKLNNEKQAAMDFIDLIYAFAPSNVYVGVVPFSHNIRMSRRLPGMDASVKHNAGLSSSLQSVMPLTNNVTRLRNYVNNMRISPDPNYAASTRTNVGTYVAGAMLLPYGALASRFDHEPTLPGAVDPVRRDKMLVLMTDGENITRFGRFVGSNFVGPGPVNPQDNTHQERLCRMLKNTYGMQIFTIIYNDPPLPAPTLQMFRDCATNPQYAFVAHNAAQLNQAYRTIAQAINRVRLSR